MTHDEMMSLLANTLADAAGHAGCLPMCAAEELLSPLYDFTKRGGCWFCPNASISELRHLYRYHPELWQLLLELQDVPNKPTERFSWRRTFREIDERFRQEGEQLSFYEER